MPTTTKDEALKRFCDTIEATGGVVELEDGNFAPEGDPEWIDLGDAYLAACGALNREPKTRPDKEQALGMSRP